MSAWRRKALEFLPQSRVLIESVDSVGYVWVELSEEFRRAVDEGDRDFIECTLKYLIWSFSDEAGMESQQSVSCGFLEDITYNKNQWKYFSTWFTPQQFRQYKGSFQYALSEQEFTHLERVFFSGAP